MQEKEERFERFWSAYPRKVAKQIAMRAFEKIDPDEVLLETMIAAIGKWKTTDQWNEAGGQYIPHPSTWLNQRRWEDELPKAGTAKGSVMAQQYEQRDYSGVQAELMAEQDREMEKHMGGVDILFFETVSIITTRRRGRRLRIIRMDPGGGSGDGDFMENTIIRIVDMEREITAEMERLVSLKREIAGVIGQVDDPALQTLLEMRYLCYRDWPEICRAMYYSNTSVHRLHQRALKKVERILGSGMKWDNMGQDGTKDSVI